jgi:hypothetical protein
LSMSDPKRVKAILRTFSPKGQGREKVVDLRTEARELDVRKTPLAFCFVLRSMFELSARAYCDDYASAGGPKASKADGSDRRLVDILRDVHDHLVTIRDVDESTNSQPELPNRTSRHLIALRHSLSAAGGDECVTVDGDDGPPFFGTAAADGDP